MTERVDIAIVGAGPVGMALALALARGGRSALLLDARDASAADRDPRMLAIAEGSRHLLAQLDAWPAAAATPITEVHISQQGGFGRTLLSARDQGLPALGHVLAYGELQRALGGAVAGAGIAIRHAWPVSTAVADADGMTLTGPAGSLRCGIVIHAEGAAGDDDTAVEVFDYGQDALLCFVEADPPLPGRAWERFTPLGPLALLPSGSRLAVVCICRRELAADLAVADDAAFIAHLEQRLAGRLRLRRPTARTRVPLALRVRRCTQRGRELWIGNAAQSLHPVSGQGLNLGLRDASELADALLAAAGDGAGDRAALAGCARRRQPDRLASIAFTDGIVRIFSNDLAPLRVLRGIGLAALDLVPAARHAFAERMIFGMRR